jgi:hypothetical protein
MSRQSRFYSLSLLWTWVHIGAREELLDNPLGRGEEELINGRHVAKFNN